MIQNEGGQLQKQDAAAATTAGASSVEANAYLAAAAVVIYTTRALWLKLQKIRSKKPSEDEVIEEDDLECDGQSSVPVQSQAIDVYPK